MEINSYQMWEDDEMVKQSMKESTYYSMTEHLKLMNEQKKFYLDIIKSLRQEIIEEIKKMIISLNFYYDANKGITINREELLKKLEENVK